MVIMLIKLPKVIVLMVWTIRYPFTSLPVQNIPNDLMRRAKKTPLNMCKHFEKMTRLSEAVHNFKWMCGAILNSSPNVPRLRGTTKPAGIRY
jgi:hypothetical protein